NGDAAMAALRFRYAPPPDSHGAGDNLELTINTDHSVGAGHTREALSACAAQCFAVLLTRHTDQIG
ncbi:hypothetical protein, partial [Erythrobacter fulvus]|uniref:hypothetical protein n=1 Tax=Erythrobacter fulvus TaxID=2987523 RepID=UPI00235A270B